MNYENIIQNIENIISYELDTVKDKGAIEALEDAIMKLELLK